MTPALDVRAATIVIRHEQRVHARVSSEKTRQISEAHGNLPGRMGASAPGGAAGRPGGKLASEPGGTIFDLAAKAGARTP